MDWQHVTVEELLSALQEADWTTPPRPLLEFAGVGKLNLPKTKVKWTSRLKNNAYHYRTNYLLLLLVFGVGALYSRLLALLGLALLCTALLALNDTFAGTLSEKIIKLIRKVHPPTASRLRTRKSVGAGLGPPGRAPGSDVQICGFKRGGVVAAGCVVALVLIYRGGALLRTLAALTLGLGIIVAHASVRQPNLKARLTGARDEFRAAWRNVQYQHHDLTL